MSALNESGRAPPLGRLLSSLLSERQSSSLMSLDSRGTYAVHARRCVSGCRSELRQRELFWKEQQLELLWVTRGDVLLGHLAPKARQVVRALTRTSRPSTGLRITLGPWSPGQACPPRELGFSDVACWPACAPPRPHVSMSRARTLRDSPMTHSTGGHPSLFDG